MVAFTVMGQDFILHYFQQLLMMLNQQLNVFGWRALSMFNALPGNHGVLLEVTAII